MIMKFIISFYYWVLTQSVEEGREEAQEEERKYFLSLLDQGLSVEEIKQRLTQTAAG